MILAPRSKRLLRKVRGRSPGHAGDFGRPGADERHAPSVRIAKPGRRSRTIRSNTAFAVPDERSEERRVGKECKCELAPRHYETIVIRRTMQPSLSPAAPSRDL